MQLSYCEFSIILYSQIATPVACDICIRYQKAEVDKKQICESTLQTKDWYSIASGKETRLNAWENGRLKKINTNEIKAINGVTEVHSGSHD